MDRHRARLFDRCVRYFNCAGVLFAGTAAAKDYSEAPVLEEITVTAQELNEADETDTTASEATWVSINAEYPSAWRLRPRTAGVSARYIFGASR